MSGEAGEGYHDNRSTAAASSCHAQIGPSSVAVTHSVAMLIDKFQFKHIQTQTHQVSASHSVLLSFCWQSALMFLILNGAQNEGYQFGNAKL